MDGEKNNELQNEAPKNDAPDEFAKCKAERDDYLAGWQRAKADFSNYKKEEMRRFEEIARYATEDLMEELINVLDNFDLGIAAMETYRMGAPTPEGGRSPNQHVGMEKGVYMIRAQIEDILKKRGLARIPVKIGDPFDPSYAESIAEEDSEKPPGTILEEIEPGYKLYDRIIRPARVKVSKQKA